jgi:hypothetical protein
MRTLSTIETMLNELTAEHRQNVTDANDKLKAAIVVRHRLKLVLTLLVSH